MLNFVKKISILLIVVFLYLGCPSGGGQNLNQGGTMDNQATQFIHRYTSWYKPLEKIWSLAQWAASTTGDPSAYDLTEKIEVEIKQLYSNRDDFAEVERIYNQRDQITDPLLKRQIELAFFSFKGNQINKELMERIVALQTELQQSFNNYRGHIGERSVTANDIVQILTTSRDNQECQQAWEASKGVGPEIAPNLIELVRLRNEAARSMGYNNYWEMQIILQEHDPQQIVQIFQELDQLTEQPFRELKNQIDAYLSQRFGVPVQELMPWNYGDVFFQDVPPTGSVNMDQFFAERDVKQIAQSFYSGIGYDVSPILEHSDLYERERKDQHAYCFHIDRTGDVRILCNLKNDERWMGTIMHELGHGIYELGIDQNLPWLLRQPAHIFTTEAVAEYFGMMIYDPNWLKGMLNIDDNQLQSVSNLLKWNHIADLLIFSRWSLVMVNFEKSLYENPDQDLNNLWWTLVERYQLLRRPSGEGRADWATKTHIVSAPVYYHNYTLGRLFSAQVAHKIAQLYPQFVQNNDLVVIGHQEIGRYFRDQIFSSGASYPWPEFVQRVTGEPLTARYFTDQLNLGSIPPLNQITTQN